LRLETLNPQQRYLIEEFAEEYRERRLGRRDLLRRVLLITGSVPSTAAVLATLGCGSAGDGGAPTATAAPTQPAPTPPPATGPGVTVQPTDPAIQVEEVRYPGPASQIFAYLARPRQAGTYPAIVVIHENQGLNEHTRDIARRFAKEGFVGLAVDLVSRAGGTMADTAQNTGFLGRSNPLDLVADLQASVDYLKQQPFVRANALGVTGFCLGGSYAFELAISSPDIRAAVPWYGTVGRIDQLGQTRAAILAIYGGTDARVTNQSGQVRERLQAAGKTFEIKVYEGAGHAFFNDTRPSYNAAAAADAWAQALAWFRRHLAA
jgi:carboxymethylenebutenolidase